jgi:hypothetical protein
VFGSGEFSNRHISKLLLLHIVLLHNKPNIHGCLLVKMAGLKIMEVCAEWTFVPNLAVAVVGFKRERLSLNIF